MPPSVRRARSWAISLSFLLRQVVLYCLRRSWCRAFRPVTVSWASLSVKDGDMVVNAPRTMVTSWSP